MVMCELQHKLPTKIFETIERAGIDTPKQILTKSTWDIKRITNLTSDDVMLLKSVAADCYKQLTLTGDQLLQRDSALLRVSLGCSAIDHQLYGGLRRGTITELYGESGSGKTQVAIQAALHTWPSGTVYICTEDLFPVKRFDQIKKTLICSAATDHGKNVFVEHVTEAHELLSCVRIRLPKLLKNNNVSLIIIDSVAAPFRVESSNYVQRAEELRELALHLISVAQDNNLAVLCINQVTGSTDGTGDNVVPSLGLAWSNMVSTRLRLRKTTSCISSDYKCEIGQLLQVRELTVMFAPDIPCSTAEFIISSSGLQVLA